VKAEKPGDVIVRILDPQYPQIKTPLAHENAFQLLVATILSAQCTDAQVNKVTPLLFAKFPNAQTMAAANVRELERIVRPTGFFHLKAMRIKKVSKTILKQHNGKVPQKMEQLLTLPGVGRKTANIVLSAGFDEIQGIAVDTHVFRLSRRIGLSDKKNPDEIEKDLMKITSKSFWPRLSLLLILHGRKICLARKPLCEQCVLSQRCLYFKQANLNS
jgi:endonuclease-3